MDRRSSTPKPGKPGRVPPLRMGRRGSNSSATPKRPSPPSSSASEASEPRRAKGTAPVMQRQRSEESQETFIKVVARVRPKLQHEGRSSDGVEVDTSRNTLTLCKTGGDSKRFTVDQVFDSRQEQGSQEAVFATFGQDFVNHALNGYNVCMFAYGHTGSGKTFTMLGDHSADLAGGQAGIMPRFLHALFAAHAQEPEQATRRRYTCEFYEVYNEQIKDLLAPAKSGERTRKVHVHPKHGVRVENLNMSVVTSAEEVLRLVAFGNQLRAVAATTMNARSSRSHAIFTFKYEQESSDGKSCQSTVTFVDLAGREDQSASQNQATQFREMCCINTSLFHLANVITKLSQGSIDGKSLSDFRNSKLTLLLSPALIGNSRTALIATLAPLQSFFDDSACTMNFAASVKNIKTRPMVNNKAPNTLVSELEAEVRQLHSELAVSKSGEAEKERALMSAQALISSYKRSWEEALAKSQESEIKRVKSLRSLGLANQDSLAPMDPNGAIPCFFTKLSNDPALQGHCNYFLRGEVLRFGSDEQRCSVVLRGVGICPQMCEVRMAQCGNVEVELLGSQNEDIPRVLVNGYPLLPSDGVRTLSHGTCLFLGYAHAFRFVAVTRDMVSTIDSSDACAVARSTVDKLDVASAVSEIVDESGEQFKDILPFISHLSTRLEETAVQSFLAALHRICPLVDEANCITREVFADDGLHFQVRALTDVFNFSEGLPEVTVCLLQKRGALAKFRSSVKTVMHERRQINSPRGGAGSIVERDTSHLLGKACHPLAHAMGLSNHMVIGQSTLLYVWSLEKFLWRLNAIREIYQDGSEAKDQFAAVRDHLSANPGQSPWRETVLEATGSSAPVSISSTGSKCSSPSPTILSPRRPSNPAIDDGHKCLAYPTSIAAPTGLHPKTSDARGKHPNGSEGSCSSASLSYEELSVSDIGVLRVVDFDPNASRELCDTPTDDTLNDDSQQLQWMCTLGAEVERLSAEVEQLQETIVSKRGAFAGKPSMVKGAQRASKQSEDITRWLNAVERLRDTLSDADRLQRQERSEAAARKLANHIQESQMQTDEPVRSLSASTCDAVLQDMESFKSEMATIVREELKDQLRGLQANASSNDSTVCSSGSRSGQLTPLDASDASIVYVPKHRLQSAAVRDAVSPPRNVGSRLQRSATPTSPGARFGPTTGVVRRSSPTLRRSSSAIQRRSEGLSQTHPGRAALRRSPGSAVAPVARVASSPLSSTGCSQRRLSPKPRSPSTSPARRRVVGIPKLTWSYYEVIDPA